MLAHLPQMQALLTNLALLRRPLSHATQATVRHQWLMERSMLR